MTRFQQEKTRRLTRGKRVNKNKNRKAVCSEATGLLRKWRGLGLPSRLPQEHESILIEMLQRLGA